MEKTKAGIFGNLNLSEREKYQYYIQSNASVPALKEKVKKAVTEKGLSALMNDAKWLKLQYSIETLPFPPEYVEKSVFEIPLSKKCR